MGLPVITGTESIEFQGYDNPLSLEHRLLDNTLRKARVTALLTIFTTQTSYLAINVLTRIQRL